MEDNNKNSNSQIEENVLKKIGADELTMRPRIYFRLKVWLIFIVSILILIVSVFFVDLILFDISDSGRSLLLNFGPRGILFFFEFFPWLLFILDIILIFILQYFLREFKFGYQSPMIYLLLGICIITISAGVFIYLETGLNDELTRQSDDGNLPSYFADFIRYSRRPPTIINGICRCAITGIKENIITAKDIDFVATTTLTIILPENDERATTTDLKIGDVVYIVGDNIDGVIHAFGVSKIVPAGSLTPSPTLFQ